MNCGWVEVGIFYLRKVFVKGGSKHPHYQANCYSVASEQFGFENWLASVCAVLKLDVATPAEHSVLFVAWVGFAILVGRHFVWLFGFTGVFTGSLYYLIMNRFTINKVGYDIVLSIFRLGVSVTVMWLFLKLMILMAASIKNFGFYWAGPLRKVS